MARIGLIILLIAGVSALSYSATDLVPARKGATTSTPWVKHADVKGTSDKIDRGVRRLLFGWTEIPKSIIQTTKETRNPIWGVTGGTLKGLAKAFPKTVSGASDIIGVPLVNPTKPPVSPEGLKVEGTTAPAAAATK